jgi:hypothetical protein
MILGARVAWLAGGGSECMEINFNSRAAGGGVLGIQPGGGTTG